MNNVNQYVNVLKKAGAKAAENNPNSDYSLLRQELVEHYKNNKTKAENLIKMVEANPDGTKTHEQKLHYEAAVIAIRGYQALPAQSTVPTNKIGAPTNMFGAPAATRDKSSELENLKRAGWVPLK